MPPSWSPGPAKEAGPDEAGDTNGGMASKLGSSVTKVSLNLKFLLPQVP